MKQTELKFQRAYQRLNKLQKAAVDHIEKGPLMVIAGPGTGKTQVLALRIANILKVTDARPDTILALTFTEAAAKNMRQRLLEMIGKDAYYVQINTFHAFCRQVIADFPEYFPLKRDSEHLPDLERYQIFEELIDEFKPENLRPLNDHYLYANDIINSISDLKREGVSVLEFEKIVEFEEKELAALKEETKAKTKIQKAEKKYKKNKDLLLLYQEYQQKLQEKLRYDYDDMINFVVNAFEENEILLREYQENLHYFLVDEYQDTNTAQNKLVNLLVSYWEERGGQADLAVVGDPNQAIYRFQGASVENVLAFTRVYPNATIITLDQAYRCPQNIYNMATELISYNQLASEEINLVLQLNSPNKEKNKIKVSVAPSQILETVYVAEEIKKLIEKGVAADEIAVLYRNNNDVNDLVETLSKWGIRYDVSNGDNVLETVEIREILALMRLVLDIRQGNEAENLYQVMLCDWTGLESLLVMKLARVAGQEKMALYDLIQQKLDFVNKRLLGQEISEEQFETIQVFISKLRGFSKLDQTLTFNHWFEQLISEEGFAILDFIEKQDNRLELINNINSLYQEIKSLLQSDAQLKLADFLNKLAIYEEHRIKIKAKNLNVKENAVHLSTVHSAKGMEWDYVFLINFVDKRWGNQRSYKKITLPDGILQNTDLSDKERNEDDRRLFYVALTRAKKQVWLSYPETIVQNNNSSDKFPSIFLEELKEIEAKLDKQELQEISQKEIDQNAESYLIKLLTAETHKEPTVDEKEFFKEILKDFKLSVTALNTYLRDPKEFIDNNLLRIPRAKAVHMSFGTAVHAALERFYKFKKQNGKSPELKTLITEFENALKKEVMTESDLEDRLKYGREVLTGYYQKYLNQEVDVFDVERSFGGRRSVMLGDIQLSGKIDRIDWVNKDRGLIRVIDYKTGKPKTDGAIEARSATYQKNLSEREMALPETIRGPYKRQLVFYKLLIDLDFTLNPKLTVVESAFDFVEPKEKGSDKYIQRIYQITDEEVQDLKNLIKEVMKELRSLSFLELLEE
jgi:DNA helicase-2/ATP-dependent DNA helicase PcrA